MTNAGQGPGGRVLAGEAEQGLADLLAKGGCQVLWPKYLQRGYTVGRAQDVEWRPGFNAGPNSLLALRP